MIFLGASEICAPNKEKGIFLIEFAPRASGIHSGVIVAKENVKAGRVLITFIQSFDEVYF